jgi:iron(III) transport system ATP-binding protein
MIAVADLGHGAGGRLLFAGLSFTVAPGQRLAVRGPSGAGKTTLLRLLAGLEAPEEGEIAIAGSVASRPGEVLVPPHERGIGFSFQSPLLWPHMSVGENVAYGIHRLARAERRSRVAELLAACGLALLADRSPLDLSGGEAARVGLARALAPRARILLLDEPFASVEPLLCERLAVVVETELAASGAALVSATHDDAVAARLGGATLDLTASGEVGRP